MAIRGVLLDVDGVVLGGNGRPVKAWPALSAGLRERDLIIGIMTSEPARLVSARLTAAGTDYDSLHSTQETGKEKPGGSLVEAFCDAHGLAPHETLVLGKDQRSMLEALNGRALGFHARPLGPSQYGIPVDHPDEFFEYVDIFFRKTHLWYARYEGHDAAGRVVHVRALIDGNGAGSPILKQLLYQTFKLRAEPEYQGVPLSKFLMMHLIASAYLDGFFSADRNRVYWQVYPGHSPTSVTPPLVTAILQGLTLFRSQMAKLTRRVAAERSHTSRVARSTENIDLANQLRTLIIDRASKVKGRRVFVLDDFTTEGYSHEAARTMFYAAGATEVVSLTVGKYGTRYRVFSPNSAASRKLNPFEANTLTVGDFLESVEHMQVDPEALVEFRQSARALRDSKIAAKLYPA